MEQSVPKRQHIKFRRQWITQKKEHNIQSMAKVWNKELLYYLMFMWPCIVDITIIRVLCLLNFITEYIQATKGHK
jgi:hypothetical protein